ncbi:MAG: Glu-tRNA(Gln) amidotransferase subunit GatE [Candidatus Diapherotrites archaeon]|nr:Glu-tRNA(Gln) amidotransferase subunit GatE [Candidatus Diapherotrites archaeon]
MPAPGTLPTSSTHPVTCGLEVHQQLDTHKLFSRCPSTLREDAPDFTFFRKLHAVASELGEYDLAALEAARKRQTYTYQGHHENTSLVETDEEPPAPMNAEALCIALEVALLCQAKTVDKITVMRKTVLDGSNTSGFQRTALVSMGGQLTLTNDMPIRVMGIALEEDSARPIGQKGEDGVYRLDRLGFPLIELATYPDIHSPEQAKETALKIGEVLRITGKMKRGLGTIRQDLNISIPGGARVEIKGVQEVGMIDEYVRREMQRQQTLLALKDTLTKEGLTKDKVNSQGATDLTLIFSNTSSPLVRKALEKQHHLWGVRLPQMKGKMGLEIQPGRRVGGEVSSYMKNKTGLQGILHGDELPAHGVTEEEVKQVREALHVQEKDSFALVMGPETKARFAIDTIKHRVSFLLEGIPEETRNALEGGNSEYSRPLPGAARMYPETDAQDIFITPSLIGDLKNTLPAWGEDRKKQYMQMGLSEKHAEEMKLDNKARFFERMVGKGYAPTLTATLLLDTFNTIRRENPQVSRLTEEQLESLLEAEKGKQVLRDNFPSILREWAINPSAPLSAVIGRLGNETMKEDEVTKVVKQIVDKHAHLVLAKGMQAQKPLMGLCMQALRGKAQGYFIAQALEKELRQRTGK